MRSIKFVQDFNFIINEVFQEIRGEKLVESYLKNNPVASSPLALLAIGKASVSMARGAAKQLNEPPQRTLVITKYKHYDGNLELPNLQVVESGHPIPDAMSLQAGQEVIELCNWLKQKCLDNPSNDNWLLCLISGGTSALVEKLKPGISLEELQSVNLQLLSSGEDIANMNLQRKQMSLLKNGGLANQLDIPTKALYLSDVPTNDPAVIGSGVLKSPHKPQISHEILADNAYARHQAQRIATELGYSVVLHPKLLENSVEESATEMLGAMRQDSGKLHIWGGEPVIKLPDNPGIGGRNQHLALLMAKHLAGKSPACFASIGTDGSDGMTEYAGAIVDNHTSGKITNLEQEIERANSMEALIQANANIMTGASGSNLMDIMLGYCEVDQ
ncbi:MAG: DUF4147 domain-containing protein [Candidatus Portiera sp.]|nr:DUF4147 domain-containing protein [Portiera sp.]